MAFRDALIAKAIEQWTWFGKDLDDGRSKYVNASGQTNNGPESSTNRRKETVEPFASRVDDYWLTIPTAEYNKLVKAKAPTLGKLDGTVNLAWSAAFVSYCMQMAGAGPLFPYSGSHVTWLLRAIKNKTANKLNAVLVGYRPGEIPLQVGDLIGKPRVAGVTYDNAVAKGWFESHSDIVVEIDLAKRKAWVIGGNVGQSVSKGEVKLDANGGLNDPGGWIVHVRNNITPPTTVAAAPTTEALAG